MCAYIYIYTCADVCVCDMYRGCNVNLLRKSLRSSEYLFSSVSGAELKAHALMLGDTWGGGGQGLTLLCVLGVDLPLPPPPPSENPTNDKPHTPQTLNPKPSSPNPKLQRLPRSGLRQLPEQAQGSRPLPLLGKPAWLPGFEGSGLGLLGCSRCRV